jgi:hypothetical protein
MGLLPTENLSLQIPEYNKLSEDIFMEFTLFCITHNKDLSVLALAAGAPLRSVSWCRDWRNVNVRRREVALFSSPKQRGQQYSASSTKPPVFQANLERRVLSLQGYKIDTIVHTGGFVHVPENGRFRWYSSLRDWKKIINGRWAQHASTKLRFNRAITAERWTEEPLEWMQRVPRDIDHFLTAKEKKYMDVLRDTCNNRRFFLSATGRFGSGPVLLKKGDTVAVLFGGGTPFILRRIWAIRRHVSDVENNALDIYHRLIGEAYVDGLMRYEGNMEDDINHGKITPEWFHLK